MANQSWITESNLGNITEGSSVETNIFYSKSTNENRITLEPVILSSNLPSSLNIIINDGSVKLIGTMPQVFNDVQYDFTLRLKEAEYSNPSNITDITDRHFYIIDKDKPVAWNPDLNYVIDSYQNTSFSIELKNYLINANGNETFLKTDGELPEGVFLTDRGTLYGIPSEEDATENKRYSFFIKVYANGVELFEEAKEFILNVYVDISDMRPQWLTEENIGNVNRNQEVKKSSGIAIVATDPYPTQYRSLYYGLVDDEGTQPEIPSGLTFNKDGIFRGICTTAQSKQWRFKAKAYIDDTETGITYESSEKEFYITTNTGSSEHNIEWESTAYDIGTFAIGEEVSATIPPASCNDGSIIEYSFSGNTYPKGLQLTKNGILYGRIDYQEIPYNSEVSFQIMAKTPYVYKSRTFIIKLKEGLGENAIKLSLRINLEYKDEYNDIKTQLNPRTKYNTSISNYTVDSFPAIDVATLKCFDKQILASMLNFGNPEIVRFGLTKSLPYSHIDSNGNITANYEVFYKSIDESTYQWDEIDCGDYPFDEKLEELKQSDEYADVELDTKLDFNNETYNTDVPGWKIIGTADTYSKLISYNTSAIKPGYYAKVLDDDRTSMTKGSIGYYIFSDDYKWNYVGNNLPQDVYSITHTHPSDSYEVFNFENVRKILSTPIYVYQKTGTYFYDEGNQQLVNVPVINTPVKILYSYVYGNSKKDISYYICNEDGSDLERVRYENHIVYKNNSAIIDTLFKPAIFISISSDTYEGNSIDGGLVTTTFNDEVNGGNIYDSFTNTLDGGLLKRVNYVLDTTSPNFIIKLRNDTNEIYRVNEIINPWCYDTTKNQFSIYENDDGTGPGTVEQGQEMVLPYITYKDVIDNSYIVFLDTNIEPLPMWKRKQPELWKANTTYKAKTIITYNSLYYKVKQQFTSGNSFVYDTNLLEIISGDAVDINLPREYFPTLDLAYYQRDTNRQYLKDLNDNELNGEYWYRKDFLFWDLIAKPVFNTNIDTFGIPFYSNENRLLDKTNGQRDLTFKIINLTSDAIIQIFVDDVEYTDGQEHPNYVKRNNTYTITKLKPGQKIKWSASDVEGKYFAEGEEYKITADEEYRISLIKKCTVTVIPEIIVDGKPVQTEATVKFDVEGYIQEGNSITVKEGTKVYYTVTKEGYLPHTDSIIAKNFEENVEVELIPYCTVTVIPTPEDADVELRASGYTQEGNSITVPEQTYVSYRAHKDGYTDITGTIKVTKTNIILRPVLRENVGTLTIIPTPDNSIVEFETSATIISNIDNTITVVCSDDASHSADIKYTVHKNGYESFVGTYTISKDEYKIINVTLPEIFSVEINTVPTDATITITDISNAKIFVGNRYYSLNTIIKENDLFYRCNSNHISNSTFALDSSYWVLISPDIGTTSVCVANGGRLTCKVERIGYKTVIRTITVVDYTVLNINLTDYDVFCTEDGDTSQYVFAAENNEEELFQEEAGSTS